VQAQRTFSDTFRAGVLESQRWRVFPNEPVSALPGLKAGTQVHRNRDRQWEAALTKRSAERKVALHPTLSEEEGGLALRLRDEDGIETVTSEQLAHKAEQADAALRTSLTKLGNTMFEADGIALELDTR
jgi:putative protease